MEKSKSKHNGCVFGHLAGENNGRAFGATRHRLTIDFIAILPMVEHFSTKHIQGFIGLGRIDQNPSNFSRISPIVICSSITSAYSGLCKAGLPSPIFHLQSSTFPPPSPIF